MRGCASVTSARSNDPRVVRTRSALRLALAEEIGATGDLTQVTVTAVADRAGITRRTFYTHYRDIPDLVANIEDDTVDDLRILVAAIADVRLDALEAAIAACEPCPGAEDVLDYFASHGPLLAALLGDGGDPAFAEKIKRMVREEVRERALSGFVPGAASAIFGYYLTFVISAEVGVLVRWLTTGMRESVNLMARVMTGLLFVRPGDLYGRPVSFNLLRFGMMLMQLDTQADSAFITGFEPANTATMLTEISADGRPVEPHAVDIGRAQDHAVAYRDDKRNDGTANGYHSGEQSTEHASERVAHASTTLPRGPSKEDEHV